MNDEELREAQRIVKAVFDDPEFVWDSVEVMTDDSGYHDISYEDFCKVLAKHVKSHTQQIALAAQETEWQKFADLMSGHIAQGNIDMRKVNLEQLLATLKSQQSQEKGQ